MTSHWGWPGSESHLQSSNPSLFSFFLFFNWVTLVNTIIQVSGIQFYKHIICVSCRVYHPIHSQPLQQ